jgi:hypothetical protein
VQRMAWRLARTVRPGQRLHAAHAARSQNVLLGAGLAANTEERCVVMSCSKDVSAPYVALQAVPSGSSRTFYKRELPCPPAVAFSSPEGEPYEHCCQTVAVVTNFITSRQLAGPDSRQVCTADAGKRLFSEALLDGTLEGFFKLIEHFRTQDEPAFCGLASLAMTLNALSVDPRRVWRGPWRYFHEKLLDCCLPLSHFEDAGVTLQEAWPRPVMKPCAPALASTSCQNLGSAEAICGAGGLPSALQRSSRRCVRGRVVLRGGVPAEAGSCRAQRARAHHRGVLPQSVFADRRARGLAAVAGRAPCYNDGHLLAAQW